MSDGREALNDETLSMLLETGRRLKGAQEAVPEGRHDSRLAEQIVRHSKAVAMFSAEHRKAGGSIDDAAKKASQEQRIEVAERWLARLPPELLRPVVERLSKAARKKA